MIGWLRPKNAAEYCNVSERTIHDFMNDGLKYIKRKGIVLIRVEDLDEYLSQYVVDDKVDVNDIVRDVLNGFQK